MVSAASRAVVLPQPVFCEPRIASWCEALPGPVAAPSSVATAGGAPGGWAGGGEQPGGTRTARLRGGKGRGAAGRNAAAAHNGDVCPKLPQIETIQTVAMACQRATTVGLPAPFSKPCERTGCCGGVRKSTRFPRISIALQL